MTTIFKKSILTLSITAILVAGVFLMSPILVDADKDKQTCPAGQVVTGIDKKGDIICTTLPAVPAPLKYIRSLESSQIPVGGIVVFVIGCDLGDISTGGGYSGAEDMDVSQSYPDGSGSWVIRVKNDGTGPIIFTAYNICLDTALPAHT